MKRIGVGDGAFKRRDVISYSDIIYVVKNGDLLGADSHGKLWFLGTTPSGLDVELIVVLSSDEEALVVIHAFPMKWRRK